MPPPPGSPEAALLDGALLIPDKTSTVERELPPQPICPGGSFNPSAAYYRRKLADWRARLAAYLTAKKIAQEQASDKQIAQKISPGYVVKGKAFPKMSFLFGLTRKNALFHRYRCDKKYMNYFGKSGGNDTPQGKYLSFTLTWGIEGLFETTSIDLVYANGEVGVFYSPRAVNSPPEIQMRSATDDVYGVTPQAGITVTTGNLWGERFQQEGVIAYQGPFTYIGGSGGILSGEYFLANDAVSGRLNTEVVGEGVGIALGVPPVEAHVYVTNSHLVFRLPIKQWAYKIQSVWHNFFHP